MGDSPEQPRWTEVRVVVPTGWHELVAAALASGPCTSVSVEREGSFDVVRTYLASTEDTPERRAEVEGAVAGLASADPDLGAAQTSFHELPPEDYIESWKASWRPFRLGRRLVVAPPWWEGTLRPGELRLELAPGGSFGSGKHPTTRACLRALLARVRGGERVLDCGSGSGILSVTAALLGASDVLGFDIDPMSRPYGEALAAANGVPERCTFREGGFEVLPGGETYDIVTANIYSDVIQLHAADLVARLAPSGWLVASGIPHHHAEDTVRALEGAGLTIVERHHPGRWCTFIGVHG